MYHVMLIQPNTTIAATSVQKFGTMIDAMIMMTYKNGTLDQISMSRWNSRSKSPPQNPIAQPIAMPTTYVQMSKIMANVIASRKP
jgi:hypothetical protein